MEIKITNDGSHTLYNATLNENYHSMHGAFDESVHVFIEAGLKPVLQQKTGIHLLEVGFGTGLNAWLTACELQERYPDHLVSYIAIEPYPVPADIVTKLNYPQVSNRYMYMQSLYNQLHAVPWEKETKIHKDRFHLRKLPVTLADFQPYWLFDLIYFDAFAPNKQPELWEKDMFRKLFDVTVPGGVLVTYCAKGQFKRDLRDMGWEVEALPGPTGKREMTRATKPLIAAV